MMTNAWGGTVTTAPENRVEDLVPQVHFVPRIILGCNFMPPMLNICV